MSKMGELDPNSMLYWYPRLKELGVPTPETLFVPIERGKVMAMIDGNADDIYFSRVIGDIKAACTMVGYPAFMRTDLCAGKHHWRDSCFIENARVINGNLFGLIEANESAGIFGLDYRAIAIRKFLKLDYKFKAFKDMPIAREFRFFARHGEILCHHPYWPKEAIWFKDRRGPPNWEADLAEISAEPESFPEAEEIVKLASSWTDDYWSLDVCYTEDKKWYLTDMALGKQSYHWDGCPHMPQIAGGK